MADVLPPSNPPPPDLPSGWIAKWDSRYNRYYYVNTSTKASQWELPTAPADGRPPTPTSPRPPSYKSSTSQKTSSLLADTERAEGIKPEHHHIPQRPLTPTEDRQNLSVPQTNPSGGSSPRPRSGLGGKIKGFLEKKANERMARPQYYTPPPLHYAGVAHPQGAYRPQVMMGGGYPIAAGYPAQRRGRGGNAMMGAGLGLGGGLLGGMMLGEALGDHDQDAYQDGFEDGADFGGDFGGGDMDFGGFD